MECQICYRGFNLTDNAPRQFPCGHTVCESCIVQMLSAPHIFCPNCKVEANGRLGLALFPRNFQVESIIVELAKRQPSIMGSLSHHLLGLPEASFRAQPATPVAQLEEDYDQCTLCQKEGGTRFASHICADCNNLALCHTHGELHSGYAAFKDHRVTVARGQACEEHFLPTVNHCDTHHRSLCRSCLSESSHSDCSMVNLKV
jgi:hypothetical protein